MSSKLTISGTAYLPFDVWTGDFHRVAVRFCRPETIGRDRGCVHVCAQNAGGYVATRRLTLSRARQGKWHRFDIKRRHLARRFLVEIEPLVALGVVDIRFDGRRIRIEA
jgi:hypothetical protein